MSAELIDLAQARALRASRGQGLPTVAPEAVLITEVSANADSKAAFLFWTGASGACYVHSSYNLFECPPVSAGNYVLVKRHLDGQRTVLSIGRAVQSTGALNLAEIRLRSAQLGANEVHVHLLADDTEQSQQIEADLRRSLVMA